MKIVFKTTGGYVYEGNFDDNFKIEENEIYTDGTWRDSIPKNKPIISIEVSK